MKKYNSNIIIFLFVVIIQNVFFYYIRLNPFSYLIGFNLEILPFFSVYTLLLIAPTVMIIFLFNETISNYLHGYGTLLIVREYSKYKILMKIQLNSFVVISILSFLEMLPSIVVYRSLPLSNIYKALIIYIIGSFALVLLEFYLEMFIQSQYLSLILCGYLLFSYFAKKIAVDNILIQILFFPSMLFEGYNKVTGAGLDFNKSILILLFIIVALISLNLRKFKTKDIL